MPFGLFKKKIDLDSNYYKRQAIYNQAKEKERERLAAAKGKADAQRLANKKPFITQLAHMGKAIADDIAAGPPKGTIFNPGTPRRTTHKRRRKHK